ncbi:hypothetical protein NRK68_29430 [Streptomyces yangpuensis]|uniref:Lipoprotein n=1 Tax=Streptomyces yangpuensis TaxID=1648182 RepID=A0ABY5Q3Z0_9ACTN|nr:hypothetical protein [Streptomyces yangpuensis]UUY50989.1 hypothetical protein NRK68_29430 [Streptomyces yangpuensis]
MPSTARPALRIRPSLAAVAAACVTVLLCGGCAGHAATPAASADEAAEPTTSIEEIATAIGCSAEVSMEAEELRQGGCQTEQGAYRMVTFAAQKGLSAWLDEARAYGGVYLVGDRWVVTTQSADALNALRGRLGGSVETGTAHNGPSSGHTDPSAPAAPSGGAAPSAPADSSEHSGHSAPPAGS